MVKFEVGKIYKATNVLGVKVYRKVIARTERFLITYTRNNDGGIPVWDGEGCHLISVVNGVEVCMDAFYNQKLSADKEASIEELEEEMKKYEKPEENKDSDDWIVGKEYEAILLNAKQRFKAVFVKDYGDDRNNYPLKFRLLFKNNKWDSFNDYDNVAESFFDSDKIIIFKHGIKSLLDWEEVKAERKPVCFEVGKEYKSGQTFVHDIWELKAIFDTKDGKTAVFYDKETNTFTHPIIKTTNSVEYTTFGYPCKKIGFIADEQYRDEIKALL